MKKSKQDEYYLNSEGNDFFKRNFANREIPDLRLNKKVIYEVQKNVDINIGDRVITSGFSKIYPPKLPVGTVSGVYDERGSYQKVVNVEIQSDFESIQNVFVVIAHNYDIN